MSRIHCPNIVMYVESGMAKSRDVYWIVMEFLSGESLDKYLERNGPMSEVEAIRVSPKQNCFTVDNLQDLYHTSQHFNHFLKSGSLLLTLF